MAEGAAPGRPRVDHLVLVGMMGSGKTTVGRLLAERLVRAHLDTDDLVSAATGQSVAEIFATGGETVFRAEEARALQGALASGEAAVISVGGGAVADPSTRWLLGRGGPVVWLRAEPATLADRLGEGGGRPLLARPPGLRLLDVVRRLDEERRPVYAGVADITVDVDDVPPAEVVERTLTALGVRARIR